MNKGLTFIFAFSLGAAAGVAVSWKVLKNKYAKEAQAEIEEIREYYAEKKAEKKEQSEADSEDREADTESDMKEYESKVAESGYSGNKVAEEGCPYVITPEEFDMGEYDAETLMYYADGVLTDDSNNIIEDVNAIVGEDSLDTFGEYDDNSVYVRNDRLKTDYEILRDDRTFAEYCDIRRKQQGG